MSVALMTLVLLDQIDYIIWNAKIFDAHAANVDFWHTPKLVTIARSADHFTQIYVHPVITAHQVTVVSFAILQFHQHRVVLCGAKKSEW